MLWKVSLFFVAAHIAFECTKVAQGRIGTPPWWIPVFAITFAVSAFCRVVFRYRNDFQLEKYNSVLAPIVQIVSGITAQSFGVFDVFAVAFTATTLILIWIYVIGTLGLVEYDEREQHFLLNRSTFYAFLRTTTEILVVRASLPRRLGRLFPFAAATLETGGMIYNKATSYKFPVFSSDFGVYAAMKSAIFLSLPLLEEWITDKLEV
jgi:hypothetical protein